MTLKLSRLIQNAHSPGLTFRALPLGIAALALLAVTAQAANLTSDGNLVTAGPQDGGGFWDTITPNRWFDAATSTSQAWSNPATPHRAIFGVNSGAAGDVQVNSAVSVGNILFSPAGSGTYTISSLGINELTLVNTTITSNATATISAKLAGSTGLKKVGTGTLTLSGNNTFQGNIDVQQGILVAASNNALPAFTTSFPALTVSSGAQLQVESGISITDYQYPTLTGTGPDGTGALRFNGASALVRGALLSGPATIGVYGGTMTTPNQIYAIGGTGSLTKAGPGTLMFAQGQFGGPNYYEGPTTVAEGTLLANQFNSSNSYSIPGNLTVNAGATFGLMGTDLIKPTSNVLTNGTFDLNSVGGSFNNMRTEINSLSGSGIVRNSFPGLNTTLLRVYGVNVDSAFSGSMQGEFNFEKLGAATLTLSGSNTFTGTTELKAGTTVISGSLSGTPSVKLARGATLSVSVGGSITELYDETSNQQGMNSGGVLVLNGNILVSYFDMEAAGTITGTGRLALDSNATEGQGSISLAGVIAPGNGGIGQLTIGGAGYLYVAPQQIRFEFFQNLLFELGAPGTSDRVKVEAAQLIYSFNFEDFLFTPLPGFGEGVYTLFDTSQALDGTFTGPTSGIIAGLPASIGFGDNGRDIILTVVPEPSAALLLIAGSLATCFRRRRPPAFSALPSSH